MSNTNWVSVEVSRANKKLDEQLSVNEGLFDQMKNCVMEMKNKKTTADFEKIVDAEIKKLIQACEKIVRSDAEIVLYKGVIKKVSEQFLNLETEKKGKGFKTFSFTQAIEAEYKSEKAKSFNMADSKLNDDLNDLIATVNDSNNNNNNESDEDDDIDIMDDGEVNMKCPISLQEYVNPVKIQSCGHTFSKSSLQSMMRGSGGVYKCPMAGCPKQFTRSEVVPDKDMITKLKMAKRRRAAIQRSQARIPGDDDDDAISL